jgi:hypothetical protein
MAKRKEWRVEVDGEVKMRGTKGEAEDCLREYRGLAAAFQLPSGTFVEMVERGEDGEEECLAKFTAQSREEHYQEMLVMFDDDSAYEQLALQEASTALTKYAEDYGMVDALRWKATDVFEAEGRFQVWHHVAELRNRDEKPMELLAALRAVIEETTECLVDRQEYLPNCTNAIDNAARAYRCKGWSEALRKLRSWERRLSRLAGEAEATAN